MSNSTLIDPALVTGPTLGNWFLSKSGEKFVRVLQLNMPAHNSNLYVFRDATHTQQQSGRSHEVLDVAAFLSVKSLLVHAVHVLNEYLLDGWEVQSAVLFAKSLHDCDYNIEKVLSGDALASCQATAIAQKKATATAKPSTVDAPTKPAAAAPAPAAAAPSQAPVATCSAGAHTVMVSARTVGELRRQLAGLSDDVVLMSMVPGLNLGVMLPASGNVLAATGILAG